MSDIITYLGHFLIGYSLSNMETLYFPMKVHCSVKTSYCSYCLSIDLKTALKKQKKFSPNEYRFIHNGLAKCGENDLYGFFSHQNNRKIFGLRIKTPEFF